MTAEAAPSQNAFERARMLERKDEGKLSLEALREIGGMGDDGAVGALLDGARYEMALRGYGVFGLDSEEEDWDGNAH